MDGMDSILVYLLCGILTLASLTASGLVIAALIGSSRLNEKGD